VGRNAPATSFLTVKIYDHHEVSAKTSDAEFADQLLLLFSGIHAQKAQGLALSGLPGGQDVQPGNGAETGTDREQRRAQCANVCVAVELIEGGLHIHFPLDICRFVLISFSRHLKLET
jgi:hypothetical protein